MWFQPPCFLMMPDSVTLFKYLCKVEWVFPRENQRIVQSKVGGPNKKIRTFKKCSDDQEFVIEKVKERKEDLFPLLFASAAGHDGFADVAFAIDVIEVARLALHCVFD